MRCFLLKKRLLPGRRSLLLLLAMGFLEGLVFYAPIATLYRQARGLTIFDITLIESVSLVVSIVLEIPWGWVADRIGYRRTLIVSYSFFFVTKLIFWQADGFSWFLAERLLVAVVTSGLSGCDSAYLYLMAGEENAQRFFGLQDVFGTAGLLTASAVFSLFLSGKDSLAALGTVFSYGGAMVLSFFLEDAPGGAPSSPSSPAAGAWKRFASQWREIWANLTQVRGFLPFLLASSLLAETHQTVTVFLSQLAYQRAGIPTALFGVLYAAATLASLLGGWSWRFTQRLGRRGGGALLFLGAAGVCLGMALFASPIAAAGGILLLRAALALWNPLSQTALNRTVRSASRATVLSIYSMVSSGVAVMTNLAFGRAADRSVASGLGLGSLFCLVGLALFLLGERNLSRLETAAPRPIPHDEP